MAVDIGHEEMRRNAEKILGPISEWRLASTTNSQVWRARTEKGSWSVKLLTDASSDAHVERRLLAELGPRHARQIFGIFDLGGGAQMVVAPYIEGELVADRLRQAPLAPNAAMTLADQFRDILTEVSRLPLRVPGYGRVGSGRAPQQQRWTDALRGYLEEQRLKGPRTSALRHSVLSGVLGRLADRLDAECGPPRMIPTDVNGRNFLITESDGALIALNFPVIWQGDPAMPYGALQLHLDDTLIAQALAEGPWARWRMHFYAAYHAFVICVYVERFSATPLEHATPWGRARPLLDLFDMHVRLMEKAL